MKSSAFAVAVVLSLVVASQAASQGNEVNRLPSNGPVVIANSEEYRIHAKNIGQDFLLQVWLPDGYSGTPQNYPIVYLLDPGLMFKGVVDDVFILSLAQEISAPIVVGIAYDVRGAAPGVGALQLRNRDLTPTLDKKFAAENPTVVAGITPGGAAAFLEFINKDVKAFVENRYRVDRERETLAGYSFGGLFGLYTLFTAPDSFDNYIIGSPAIWWDNGVIFNDEKAFAERRRSLRKKVFMSVGEREEAFMVRDFKTMLSRLQSRKYSRFQLQSHIFEGETHASGMGVAMNRGLPSVLSTKSP
jgi:predicted alpha/beta superfamily hydrolase